MKNTPGEFLESSKRLTPEFLQARKKGLPHSVFPRRCNPFRMATGAIVNLPFSGGPAYGSDELLPRRRDCQKGLLWPSCGNRGPV